MTRTVGGITTQLMVSIQTNPEVCQPVQAASISSDKSRERDVEYEQEPLSWKTGIEASFLIIRLETESPFALAQPNSFTFPEE